MSHAESEGEPGAGDTRTMIRRTLLWELLHFPAVNKSRASDQTFKHVLYFNLCDTRWALLVWQNECKSEHWEEFVSHYVLYLSECIIKTGCVSKACKECFGWKFISVWLKICAKSRISCSENIKMLLINKNLCSFLWDSK